MIYLNFNLSDYQTDKKFQVEIVCVKELKNPSYIIFNILNTYIFS